MGKKLVSVTLLLLELSVIFSHSVPVAEEKSKPLEIDFDGNLRPFTNSHGFPFTAEEVQSKSADGPVAPEYVESTAEPPSITTESKNLKMQQARTSLLNKLKERRNKTKNNRKAASGRIKRQFDEIPEAPKLEEMELPRFAYLLDTDQRPTDDEQMKSNIRDEVKSIFVTLSPIDETEPEGDKDVVGYLVEDEHGNPESQHAGYDKDGNKVIYVTEPDNKEDSKPDSIEPQSSEVEPISRTYGMDLSNDKGYVWNTIDDERMKSKIRDEVKSIFVTLRPFEETQPNDDKDVVGYLVEEEHGNPEGQHASYHNDDSEVVFLIDQDNRDDGRPDSIVTQRSQVTVNSRTYGMNLSSGHGYIWNKLVSPQVVYTIDSQDYAYEVTPIIDIDIDGNKVHVTESPDHNDIYVNIQKVPKLNSTTARNEKLTDNPTEDKNIGKENDVDKTKDDKPNNNGKKPLKSNPVDDDDDNSKDNKAQDKNVKDKEPTKPKPNLDNSDKKPAQLNDKKPIEEKTELQKEKEPAKKEEPNVDQLNKEKITELLGYWTRPYLEYLTQAVKDMVKKEVKRQLENYKPIADEPKINKTKDSATEPEPPTENDKKNPNVKNDKQKLSENKPTENRPTEEKPTENIDKKPVDAEPKTNNTKPDDKENPHENPQDPYKVIKDNNKTTNIFIFFPNSSTAEIIQNILGNNNDPSKPADSKKQADTPDKDNPEKKSIDTLNNPTTSKNEPTTTVAPQPSNPLTTTSKDELTTTIAPQASNPLTTTTTTKDELLTTTDASQASTSLTTSKNELSTTTVASQSQTNTTLNDTTTENPLTTSSTTTSTTSTST